MTESITERLPRLMYRVREVADITALSRPEVYRRIASGELTSVRVGRAIRVPVDALSAWTTELAGGR